jgi:murein DD-endopeptidase MepM/ murein hydrolase activator NlpD
MQNNIKFYTFLLSHSSKNRIYIRRVSVSRNLLHFASVGIFLIIGVTMLGIGVTGVVRGTVLAKTNDPMPIAAQASILPVQPEPQIDYDRPSASDVVVNAGGPEINETGDPEDSAIERELRAAASTMNPEFLPTVWPHVGKINNEFGFRRNPFGGRSYEFHPGMDIDGERGQVVLAPASGTIIKAASTGGYGNMIQIDHGNGISTRYGHLSKIEVSVGDTITRGEEIGLIGSTGRSTGPHLHFELRLNERSINPRFFLPPEPTDIVKGK